MRQDVLYKTAVIVHAISSLFGVLTSLPALMEGPNAHTITEGVPQFVVMASALLGMAGLISAYGAWKYQKWGMMLAIFTEAISGLLALPGVLMAPTEFARVSSITGVLIAVFVIYVLLRGVRFVPSPTRNR